MVTSLPSSNGVFFPAVGPKMLEFDSPDSLTQFGTPALSMSASIDDYATPVPDLFTYGMPTPPHLALSVSHYTSQVCIQPIH